MKPRHLMLTVLATVVIFAAGVATGGLLVRKLLPPPPATQPGWPMARFDQFQRAVDTMDLRPEQRRKIRGIIRERQAYVADMMRLIEPDLPGLFVKLRDDINQELTDGQQHDLDELWNRMQQRRMANRGGEYFGRPGDNSGFPGEFPPDGRKPPPRPGGAGGPGPRPMGPLRGPDRMPPPGGRTAPTNLLPTNQPLPAPAP